MIPKYLDAYRMIWAKMLLLTGSESDGKQLSVLILAVSFGVGFLIAAMVPEDNIYMRLVAMIGGAGIIQLGMYAYFYIGVSARASKVEEVLPDFLELMSSNIRSGLTPDKALIVSARPEFGPLSDAVYKAGTRSITGVPLDEVMLGIGETIQSDALNKTIRMIIEGMHSGGDMAELLSKTALDLRKFRSVRKEVNSAILSYVLFIAAAITFGAPLLYGVASYLTEVMIQIKGKVRLGDQTASITKSMALFKGKLMLTMDGVIWFSVAAILITVFFGCIAVGSMMYGKKISGLKYFPLLAGIALALFFAVRFGLGFVFGSLMSFG